MRRFESTFDVVSPYGSLGDIAGKFQRERRRYPLHAVVHADKKHAFSAAAERKARYLPAAHAFSYGKDLDGTFLFQLFRLLRHLSVADLFAIIHKTLLFCFSLLIFYEHIFDFDKIFQKNANKGLTF